jgi:adenylate kinase family enzyme
MYVNEIIKPVEEGVNDPHIFKAVFLAGGPGSGKSFVANKMLRGTGLRTVNSDDIYEYMMGKAGKELTPDSIYSDEGQEIRDRAKKITKNKEASHIEGRLGLIIDGTGKDVTKVQTASEQLKSLGYETMMLFVNTSEDVAQDRNSARARSLPKEQVTKMWQTVQQNLMKFQQLFGAGNFHIVDNSGGLEDPDRKANFLEVDRAIDKFLMSAPSDRRAKKWITDQKSSK